ncbi:hypothetical protein ACWFRB_04025 [Rhodococcus sp. NPDC055112]
MRSATAEANTRSCFSSSCSVTGSHRLHPILRGMRPDKAPAEVHRE